MEKDTPTKNNEPLAIIETRVSNIRQLDGTHEFQEAECRKLAASLGIEVALDGVFHTTVSGDSDERGLLTDVLKYVDERAKKNRRHVTHYLCYNIERFTRGGHSMYDSMKKELRSRGLIVKDVAGVIQPEKNTMENLGMEYKWSHYSPSETQELLEADRAKDNKRDMLTRMIGQEIINAREGFAVHPAPDGMINKREHYFDGNGKRKRRSTRQADPERAKFYVAMFELRAAGQKTDEEIAEIINKMGYRSVVRRRFSKDHKRVVGTTGGIKLTVKQLQQVVQRPIYAGVNYEEYTHWKPVRTQYAGLVSISKWNEANRGRWFIEELQDGSLKMHQNYNPEARSHDNPEYPFKEVILCTECHKPFHGSASRSRNGKHVPAYHCERKVNGVRHKRVSANKYKFEANVESFVNGIEFQPELLKAFHLVLMDTFNQKQSGAISAATDAGKRVTELQEQKQAATKAYIAANATGDEELKQDIQLERARIDRELKVAQNYRDELEVTERDLEEFIWRVNWVMEHPQEFLLRASNKAQRKAYFSLMFEELPTYQEVMDGTAKLSWIFKLDQSQNVNESDMVRREGFEPP